jgi:hypothetical protein
MYRPCTRTELSPHRQTAAVARTRVLNTTRSGRLSTSSVNNADRCGNSSKSTSREHAIHDGRGLAGQIRPTAMLVEMRQDPVELDP